MTSHRRIFLICVSFSLLFTIFTIAASAQQGGDRSASSATHSLSAPDANRLTILYNFTGATDGGAPGIGGLTYLNGVFYGTTLYNGDGDGLVYELSNPQNTGWIDTPILELCADSGVSCNPDGVALLSSGVVVDHAGNLWGTANLGGGTLGEGALYELTPSNGVWNSSWTNICCSPVSGVVVDAEDNLYGTVPGVQSSKICNGYPGGCGGIYEISAQGNYSLIYTFSGGFDGLSPISPLTVYGHTLYGTTPTGGIGYGNVFKLEQVKQAWIEESSYAFCSPGTNCPYGANPSGALLVGPGDTLYGTTLLGGSNGKGTIFQFTPDPLRRSWTQTVLYNFCSQANCADGSYPRAGLISDKAGNLYGTTCNDTISVFNLPPSPYFTPPGIVFQLTPAGAFNVLATVPGCSLAPLTLVGSTLYGTISTGGANGFGAVFSVTIEPLTSTTLTSTLNPSTYGQSVTLTATVAPSGSITPTGRVTFTWGNGYSVGSATLNANGVATLTKSTLNADTYPITATYAGDANNAGSTSSVLDQVVQPAISSITLKSSSNPSISGQAVTFTARVTCPTTRPSGPVTFTAGNTVLGTVNLSSGSAAFTTSSLPSGSTEVTATYAGDSNIQGSTASVTQIVQ